MTLRRWRPSRRRATAPRTTPRRTHARGRPHVPFTVQPPTALLARAAKTGKLAAFGGTSFANPASTPCSLPAFFPAEARARGMGDDVVGLTFAIFAAVVVVGAPLAAHLMDSVGRRTVYLVGLGTVALATAAMGPAAPLHGAPFIALCLALRVLQGLGSALEETAAYALVVDLVGADEASFYLGVCEHSTGLGYIVGNTRRRALQRRRLRGTVCRARRAAPRRGGVHWRRPAALKGHTRQWHRRRGAAAAARLAAQRAYRRVARRVRAGKPDYA